jgi:hypothetical protein
MWLLTVIWRTSGTGTLLAQNAASLATLDGARRDDVLRLNRWTAIVE